MDEDLKFFLIIVGVVVVARVVTFVLGPKEVEQERMGKIASSCPPHKWSYHPQTEKLTCTECNYAAGSHKTQQGEY